jgi:hypothetical protein
MGEGFSHIDCRQGPGPRSLRLRPGWAGAVARRSEPFIITDNQLPPRHDPGKAPAAVWLPAAAWLTDIGHFALVPRLSVAAVGNNSAEHQQQRQPSEGYTILQSQCSQRTKERATASACRRGHGGPCHGGHVEHGVALTSVRAIQ